MIVGAIVFTVYYYTGSGLDDYIMLFLAVPTEMIDEIIRVINKKRIKKLKEAPSFISFNFLYELVNTVIVYNKSTT